MNKLKIGIRLESLGLPLRQALVEAARTGVSGVQIDASGPLAPAQLSQSGRREFRSLLRVHNLELTALGCPLRRGLDAAEDQQQRLEYVRDVMTLAFELGPRLVVVQAGAVPDKEDTADAARMREALTLLGGHGDRVGSALALETGLESGAALARYLNTFDSGSLRVNLDPANLLLHGFEPLQATRDLAGRIAHVHARDGRKSSASRTAGEVPLGHGDIDWLGFTEVLLAVEYQGWLVVEREQGDSRLADVQHGVAFLRRFLG